jgi:hypothetical protein
LPLTQHSQQLQDLDLQVGVLDATHIVLRVKPTLRQRQTKDVWDSKTVCKGGAKKGQGDS